MEDSVNSLLRQLPSVNEVLARPEVAALVPRYSHEAVTTLARVAVAELRECLLHGVVTGEGLPEAIAGLGRLMEQVLQEQTAPKLRRVINATGVILQTNLGRAPLSAAAVARVTEVALGYCNLEFDLVAGERSRRDVLVEGLLLRVLGLDETWGAVVVNNCAAATFLGLNTLAEGGEVLVSRGELVEIGGGFRVPDILRKSQARLREVGTTNKTRVADYREAMGPETRLILRVHRSNFEIRGFTEQPAVEDLVALGRELGVPVFEDQGTGCLVDLDALGLRGEGSLRGSVRRGVDLVAASGDKLLGGPQCGLLVGRAEVITRVRRNPLFRALRVDKMSYAALEATLLAYVTGQEGALPVVRMLRVSADEVRGRCERYMEALRAEPSDRVEVGVVATESVVGGGTTPGASLPSFAVSVRVRDVAESELAGRLRGLRVPVVGRVSEGRVLLDLRTVAPEEDAEVLALLQEALQ